MAKKEVSIIIRAKSLMAQGIKSAEKALKKFGSMALSVGKWISVGFLAGGAAIAGMAAKAIAAYSVQQKAEIGLASAIRMRGESVASILPKLKAEAAAIQDETGAADESTIAGMARASMLGVATNRLGEAARATIALESAGMSNESAQKAVARAMLGSYDALNEYIPALRMAKSESEKADIANRFFADGYKQQSALLNTVSGRWKEFKGRVGDALEEIGRAIEKSAGLQRILESASGAVKKFGAAIASWVDSEQFAALQTTLSGIVNAIKSGGQDRSRMAKALADLTVAAFVLAAQKSAEILMKAAPVIGKLIGGGAAAIMDAVRPMHKATLQEAYYSLRGQYLESGSGEAGYNKPDILGLPAKEGFFFGKGNFISKNQKDWTDAQREMIRLEAIRIRQEKTLKDLGLDSVQYAEDSLAATSRFEMAWANVVAFSGQFADNVKEANDQSVYVPNTAGVRGFIDLKAERTAQLEQRGAVGEVLAEQLAQSQEVRDANAAYAQSQKDSVKASEDAERAKKMFLDKDFRISEKARIRQEEKEKAMMARALAAGERGLKSATITRAQEADAARKKAEEKAAQVEADRIRSLEAQDKLDSIMSGIETNVSDIATNTLGLADKMEEIATAAD